ncbi:MAG: Trk system potassium transporter TrkA [Bacteroidaceae bacterium]|nr:Trk system potassium transporter TrkA [Bacteroidaceae bacterium]
MKTVISGANGIGLHLATLLLKDKEDVVLIDLNEEKLNYLSGSFDLMTINASPTSVQVLKDAGISGADLFVGVNADENVNITSCMLANALGAKKTIARVDNPEYLKPNIKELFQAKGINDLVYPELLAGLDIESSLHTSWARVRWDVHGGALVLLGVKLREQCEILDKPLYTICGPDDPFHIVAIKRNGETLIPSGNEELKLYDIAYFMTTKDQIPYIRKIVGKEKYPDVRNVIIIGGGKTSVRAAKAMAGKFRVKIIESDEKRCEELNELFDDDNIMIINGDGRDINLLTDEGISKVQAYVALTGNSETNILACLTAKTLGVRKTVAMVENLDYVNMAENMDIGTIINKRTITASHIYQKTLKADVKDVRFMMTLEADVAEFVVGANAKVTKALVKDLKLPADMNIGGLIRNGEGILVSGNTQIMPGDKVVVFFHETMIRKMEKYFT